MMATYIHNNYQKVLLKSILISSPLFKILSPFTNTGFFPIYCSFQIENQILIELEEVFTCLRFTCCLKFEDSEISINSCCVLQYRASCFLSEKNWVKNSRPMTNPLSLVSCFSFLPFSTSTIQNSSTPINNYHTSLRTEKNLSVKQWNRTKKCWRLNH